MRILVSAFSCAPDGGSEEAVGWNWVVEMARRGHHVTVLTAGDDAATAALEAADTPDCLDFVVVSEPGWARLVPGQLHWYATYLGWQWRIRRIAQRVVAERNIDVIHHLTWASLQLGTFLGELDVPLVFGPVGGGQTAPPSLRRYYHGNWAAERLRSVITRIFIRLDPFAVRTMRQAAVAVADNSETAALMKQLGARQVHEQTQVGVRATDIRAPDPARRSEEELVLLWVGRLMPRKGLPLALEAMRRVPEDVPVRLRIVGYGPAEEQVQGWIDQAGLAGRVEFVGRVPYHDMVQTYRGADALLFTSIRDSGGIQLVEAMGQGLPCIALRHHGARLLVTEEAGLRVAVTTAEGTAAGLADAICSLARDRALWWKLAQGAHHRVRSLTWESLVEQLEPVLRGQVPA